MSNEEIVNTFMARITSMDFDGALELVADDIEYDNVPMGPVYGPDGIRGVFAQLEGTVDKMEWVIHRQVASGDLVLNERTDRFGAGDKWADLPVAGIFEVHDGKITLWRDYFDMTTMMTQVGTLAG
ncbi:MAG: nuclear transport factor 2 family protein [Acidimicrobiia bacterium]|nr:nuclear transport factor 2 family protein [Acidimicrobiia bacterium]